MIHSEVVGFESFEYDKSILFKRVTYGKELVEICGCYFWGKKFVQPEISRVFWVCCAVNFVNYFI
ncbi:hypothetical protein DZC31_30955 (plasmid) [Stenotrophomonas rhizophila]|nr:hypothetical protein DZC31_27260 [Stenotrophomonas rhizophila]AXQ51106.1 hypothetical protein DZC31_30955 [Stenotrophomonas rhizophila]